MTAAGQLVAMLEQPEVPERFRRMRAERRVELMDKRQDTLQSEWDYLEEAPLGPYRIVRVGNRSGPGITVADESLAAYIVALHNENLGRLVFL